jgi:hypothetical protein
MESPTCQLSVACCCWWVIAVLTAAAATAATAAAAATAATAAAAVLQLSDISAKVSAGLTALTATAVYDLDSHKKVSSTHCQAVQLHVTGHRSPTQLSGTRYLRTSAPLQDRSAGQVTCPQVHYTSAVQTEFEWNPDQAVDDALVLLLQQQYHHTVLVLLYCCTAVLLLYRSSTCWICGASRAASLLPAPSWHINT